MTWIYEVFVEIEKTVWRQVKITLWWPCRVQPKRSMNSSADWIQARCSAYNHACFSNHCRAQGHNHDSLEDIKARMAENPALTLNPWLSALFGEARRAANAPQPLHWVHSSQCSTTLSQTHISNLTKLYPWLLHTFCTYFGIDSQICTEGAETFLSRSFVYPQLFSVFLCFRDFHLTDLLSLLYNPYLSCNST